MRSTARGAATEARRVLPDGGGRTRFAPAPCECVLTSRWRRWLT